MGLKEYIGKVSVGDCIERMKEMPDNSIDSVITDPPYEIAFMGKGWDNSGISFNTEVWAECLRVAKPGAFLLAFGGTRTWHRIACAIEDAGWVLRDTIAWHYGSGFPKSKSLRDVGEDWVGHGTALKPSFEPIMVFMKPCDGTFAQNAEKWGLAGLDIDGSRIGTNPGYKYNADKNGTTFHGQQGERIRQTAEKKGSDTIESTQGRWPANTILSCACDGEHAEDCPVRIMDEQSGVSKSQGGRINKKSDSAVNCVPSGNHKAGDPGYGDVGGASRFFYCAKPSRAEKEAGLEGFEAQERFQQGNYSQSPVCSVCDKTFNGTNNHDECGENTMIYKSKDENKVTKNSHATVKPISLMRYLCKLTRPPHGGIVLDPFTGSGTTGIAAILEGRDFIGFELSPEYTDIANARIEHHRKSLIKEYDEEL